MAIEKVSYYKLSEKEYKNLVHSGASNRELLKSLKAENKALKAKIVELDKLIPKAVKREVVLKQRAVSKKKQTPKNKTIPTPETVPTTEK